MREHGALILGRYSTDRQNETSIEEQVEKCTEWCNAQRIPILGVYADMAISGMKDTRPQYQLMMQALREDRADMVVIYDQSRMFRKMTAWFDFRDELESMGVAVISVTQPMIGKDLRDPANFLTEGSMALFNQMWVLQTRQRVIVTMRHMAKSGLHTGGTPPLGYQVQEGRMVICESEAQIVRRIFDEYATGKTYREIIAGLNADGIKTRSGKQFGSNSLHDLLKNEKYIGVLVYGKTPRKADGRRNSHGARPSDCIRMENAVPAIVDQDVWDRVQQKMARNKRDKAGRPSTTRNYPLKGKIYCGLCKSAMVVATSSSKYHYYACSGKQRLHTCEMMPIKMENLEQTVANAVLDVLGQPSNINTLIQILREERDKLQGGATAQLQSLSARQADITRQLDQATMAILQGLNSPTLVRKVQELEGEKAAVEREVRRLKNSVCASAASENQLRELLESIIEAKDTESILAVVCRVEVSPSEIVIWTMLDTDDGGDFRDRMELEDSHVIKIDGDGPPAPNKKRKASAFLFLFYGGRARTHLNATLRGSVAREGLTERNINFCPKGTKMQIEPGHRRLRSKSSPATGDCEANQARPSQHHTFLAPSSYWENAQKTMSSFVGYSAFTAEYAK